MRTPPPSAGDGTCYKRCNDDGASSFRKRDNDGSGKRRTVVKSLFKHLNHFQEVANHEGNNFS